MPTFTVDVVRTRQEHTKLVLNASSPEKAQEAALNTVASAGHLLSWDLDPEAGEVTVTQVQVRVPVDTVQVDVAQINNSNPCDHQWEYAGTDRGGSNKGDDRYVCKKCGEKTVGYIR